MKRIILSGGGTGGHIYPAVTIARKLENVEPVEILFVYRKKDTVLRPYRHQDLREKSHLKM